MSACVWLEVNDPIAGAVNPVPLIPAMLARVTGFCKGTLINEGILAVAGNPLTIDKITVSSTPAVPRSYLLSANLAKAEVVPLTLCPGTNPTNAPAAT
jgi:hypothetical protein